MNHSMIEVVFKVEAPIGCGEEIRVIGNVPALGCNDRSRSIPLVCSPATYPWWTTKEGIFLPGEAGAVQYRYCIYSGGKFKCFEGEGNIRRQLDEFKNDKLLIETEDKLHCLSSDSRLTGIPSSLDVKTSLNKVFASSEVRSFRARQFASWSHRVHMDHQLVSQDGVIIVSYFLPVILSKSKEGKWSAAWDGENLLSLQMDMRLIWIGSIRFANASIPVEEEEAVSAVLAELNCYPVFINQNTHFQFYDIFCKKNLWPIMHHIADVYGPLNQNDIGAKAQQNLWFVYSTVHKLFREKVLEVYHEGYLIWIHGFHLMLLPNFLRRRLPAAKIGYFFHTPFPSSEIWRTMSRREDLLRGILGADQIGFHLFEYARHFLTNVRRLLGCSYEMNAAGMMTVTVDGREVVITCIHVGVDLPRVDDILRIDSTTAEMKLWKSKFPNKVIVAGIDRLERLKGIPLKLIAINQFLDENSHWLGKLVFAIIGISAGERGQDYIQTQHDVKVTVNRLNDKYRSRCQGGDIIYFEERSDREIRLAQRLAFFGASDILFITAPRDGLNRYPMEFTLARHRAGLTAPELFTSLPGACARSEGLVIVSEFISSARVMRGALTVNPWNTTDVKEALVAALEMTPVERADRNRRNLEYATRLTSTNWATHVLCDLKSVEKSTDPNANYAVGFGMQYKVMDLKAGFHALDVKEVCNSYRSARSRLIIMDWGGTLVTDVKVDKLQAYAIAKGHAHRDGPTAELKSVIEALCADPKNYVFVVSGREVPALSQFFGNFTDLGLGAEHGFYYRWPRDEFISDTGGVAITSHSGSPSNTGKWKTIMEVGDQSWKDSAKLLMDIYTQRTHGTYIEQKGNALIWQYRDADPEFGFLQSKELEEHLTEIMSPYAVQVIRGGGVSDGYIEIRPAGVSKGLFLEHIVNHLKSLKNDCDFVLAIGDDATDEPMFEAVARIQEKEKATSRESRSPTQRGGSPPELAAFSVTVGKKPTLAQGYLDDTSAVLELLTTLSKYTQRDKTKFYSTADLMGINSLSTESQHNAGFNSLSESPGIRSKKASSSDGNFQEVEPRPPSVSIMPPKNSSGDPSADDDELFGMPPVGPAAIPRNASLINMMEYMNSIQESNQEDDGAIFF